MRCERGNPKKEAESRPSRRTSEAVRFSLRVTALVLEAHSQIDHPNPEYSKIQGTWRSTKIQSLQGLDTRTGHPAFRRGSNMAYNLFDVVCNADLSKVVIFGGSSYSVPMLEQI